MLRSIHARLVASYLLLVVVLVLAVALAVAVIVARTYVASEQRQLLQAVSDVARLAGGLGRVPGEVPANVLLLAARLTGADALFVDRSGNVLAESRDPPRFEGRAFYPAMAGSVLREGNPQVQVARLGQTGTVLVAMAPLPSSSGYQGVIALYKQVRDLRVARGAAMSPLVRAGIAGVILALFLALLLARGIAEPIGRVTAAAKSLAEGRTGARSGLTSKDEVGQLGQAFDHMAGRLDHLVRGLTEERDRVKAILEGVASGLFAVDARGRVLLANDRTRELLGISGGGVAETGSERAASGEDQVPVDLSALRDRGVIEATQEALRRAAAGQGEPVAAEIELASTHRSAVVRVTPQPFSGGAVGIIQDITEIRNLEKLRRDLVSNVSHELRTPVTSILGFLEALRDGLPRSEEERTRYLEIIEDEARRLNRLIEDLFELSKLESGQAELEPATLDLAELARLSASKLSIVAAEGGQTIDVRASGEVKVTGDRDRLAQVILNLLENALRFTPAGGRAQLSVEGGATGGAVLAVSDSGPGIHPDDLPHIFDRFFTGDKSRSRGGEWRTRGTGLGLAIVKHIVEAHGGKITVQSELGRGATFTVELP